MNKNREKVIVRKRDARYRTKNKIPVRNQILKHNVVKFQLTMKSITLSNPNNRLIEPSSQRINPLRIDVSTDCATTDNGNKSNNNDKQEDVISTQDTSANDTANDCASTYRCFY